MGLPSVIILMDVNTLKPPIVSMTSAKRIVGRMLGSVMYQNFFHPVQPSTSAAS